MNLDKETTASTTGYLSLSWNVLTWMVQHRIRQFFASDKDNVTLLIPKIPDEKSFLHDFVHENELGQLEFWALLMALAPHLRLHFWDQTIQEALPQAGDFPQIGGTRGKQFRGFIPTGETILFILAGEDGMERLKVLKIFRPDHLFALKKILYLEETPEGEPQMSGKLILNPGYISKLIFGQQDLPQFSVQFPAQLLRTKMTRKELILNAQTEEQINEIRSWLKYSKKLMGELGMGRKLRPGYRALFYGPPGTGKTLCASLLGQEFGIEVFRVDLSMVVSKYIGETEKNLAKLFDRAQHLNWILFFDEGDALFGKRTQVKDAHDRFANQEVSYLMQRIETYEGLVILASNLKGNMDDAFTRRFESIIYFPHPTPEEQLTIWKIAFPEFLQPAKDIDFPLISHRYKLSGSNIMNIVHYTCLSALACQQGFISTELLLKGIHRELMKEGRS